MLTRKEAGYFYDKLTHFYLEKELSPIARISQICSCFREFYAVLSSRNNRFFPNFYSKFEFINRLLEIDSQLEAKLRAVRGIDQSLHNPKLTVISQNTTAFTLKTIVEIIQKASGIEPPIELSAISADENKISLVKNYQLPPEDFTGLIVSKNSKDLIEAIYQNNLVINILIAGNWQNAWKYLKEGENFNAFGLKKSGENTFIADNSSVIILEPDYLVDVTDISECFTSGGVVPYIFFLRLFGKSQISPALVVGSIVNSVFDELISDQNIDFELAIDRAKRSRPLTLFALSDKKEFVKGFNSSIKYYFDNIKKNLIEFKAKRSTVEPSFISSNLGMQRRLDLMLEQDGSRKDVVELKSGSPPSVTGHMKISEKDSIPTGLWNAHAAQANAYDMLLNDAFDSRTGVSMIFYAKDEITPLRNSASPPIIRQMIADTRNVIVATIKAISNGNHAIFEYISNKLDYKLPPYMQEEVELFANNYNKLSELEKSYFHEFSSFQFREIISDKIGNSATDSLGFSSFWKMSKEIKSANYSIISGAMLNLVRSDFKNLHLEFDISDDSILKTSIRKGDIVIIYPDEEPYITNPLKGMIFRGSLRSLDKYSAKVSLRNKMLNADYVFKHPKWNIVPDSIDSNSRKVFTALYEFITAPESKRNLVLGISKPGVSEKAFLPYTYLNDSHSRAFKKAIAANDYFLLQGPPGTGKTSRFLRSLAEYFYHETGETILILAATNRAVSEIAESIKNISRRTPYLRLGSKDGADADENLIAALADTMELPSLRKLIENSRIIISTVSSAINNPEIFLIKKFDAAIIDEASQIPEPQALGITLKVPKFIMIGDERQLPAVIRQTPEETASICVELNKIGVDNLSTSMFERLLKLAKVNDWDHVFAMLETQYRMNPLISEFSSSQFYLGKLVAGKKHFLNILDHQKSDDLPHILKILAEKRIMFINTPATGEKKSNVHEAGLAAYLAIELSEKFGKNLSPSSIGIIAPFRSQCAAIRTGLPDHLQELIVCDTVERFQGSERDVIILSLSINRLFELSNIASRTAIEGQEIDRKLNVAMTRARDYLVIMGSADILFQDEIFASLISFCRNRGGYVNFSEIIPYKTNNAIKNSIKP